MILNGEEMRRTNSDMAIIRMHCLWLIRKHHIHTAPEIIRVFKENNYTDGAIRLPSDRKTIHSILREPEFRIAIDLVKSMRQREKRGSRFIEIKGVSTLTKRKYGKTPKETEKEKRKDKISYDAYLKQLLKFGERGRAIANSGKTEIEISRLLTKLSSRQLKFSLNNRYVNSYVNPKTGKISYSGQYLAGVDLKKTGKKYEPYIEVTTREGKIITVKKDTLNKPTNDKPESDLPGDATRSLWVFDNRNNHRNKTGNHQHFWYTENAEEFLKGPIEHCNEPKITDATFYFLEEHRKIHDYNDLNKKKNIKSEMSKFQQKELRELMEYGYKNYYVFEIQKKNKKSLLKNDGNDYNDIARESEGLPQDDETRYTN